MIAKMPSAEMVVSVGVYHEKTTCTRELSRSSPERFQLFATSDERSSVVANTSVIEDQDLQWRS